MRIGMNATCFNERPSGATQRFRGIYGALFAQCPDIEFYLYEPSDCRVSAWFAGMPNVVAVPTPIPSCGRFTRIIRGSTYWRRAFVRDRLDLLHNFHLPVVQAPCPTVVTIHDVRSAGRGIYGAVIRRSMQRAGCVITVSETMRQELLAIAPSSAVESVYNGVDPSLFEAPGDIEEVRKRLDLPQRFLLAVGHLETRKNYARLIEAFALLAERYGELGLVIVGNESGEGKGIAARIRCLGLEGRVCLLHDVNDEELAAIYALSCMVVFPSTYEGFGIPVIEAMAASRPLACSDIAVFRELTEGQAAYFDPLDSAAMASAISRCSA